MVTYDDETKIVDIIQRGIERGTSNVVPIAVKYREDSCNALPWKHSHINRSVLLQDFGGICRLVVECDICTRLFCPLDLLLRSR